MRKECVEEDRKLPNGWRTGELLKTIGNSISEHIQLTMDCPESNASGWMPLLDLKARVTTGGKVEHRFFKKEMASRYCIMERSALSKSVKRATLMQEGLQG